MSLPLREHGLKPSMVVTNETASGSLPLRERGLKQCQRGIDVFKSLFIKVEIV